MSYRLKALMLLVISPVAVPAYYLWYYRCDMLDDWRFLLRGVLHGKDGR